MWLANVVQGAWWRSFFSSLLRESLPTSLGRLCMKGYLWALWCVV